MSQLTAAHVPSKDLTFMKSTSSLLCSQKLFNSSTPHHLFISMIHFPTIHLSMSSYPRCSAPLRLSGWTWLNIHTYCNSPLHATYSLFTQKTVLTEDNWCSIVCRLKNPCCSLRTTVQQELDPAHTVPAHRGKHCSINTAVTIYDHKRFTTLQLCWTSSSARAQSVELSEIPTGHLLNTR